MFTVIITTFNRDKFLKKAYKSAVSQSFKPSEIIIINNGKYQYNDKDFSFINNSKFKLKIINNKKNFFQSKARNLGAKNSKNKYLCFLDDDDTWEIDYLKEAKRIIEKKKPNIILSKMFIKKRLFKDPSKLNMSNILIKNPGVNGSNIIIEKKTFFELKGYDYRLEPSEDKSLVIDALIKKKKICVSTKKIFFSSHTQSRQITNYDRLSKGVNNFYKKYYKIMNINQKIYVLNRIYIYNLKSYRIYYFPFFIIFFMLNILIRINLNKTNN